MRQLVALVVQVAQLPLQGRQVWAWRYLPAGQVAQSVVDPLTQVAQGAWQGTYGTLQTEKYGLPIFEVEAEHVFEHVPLAM